ncbi:MAG: ABC transporter permease [Actinobacteria bacterium]|jgi:peptide/nickel transport system permease protein|nr:MAG: ABC transporter permease [Actinomycetota bacterium]
MRIDYVLKRLGLFLVILWVASTVNFFLPRLGGGDPIRTQLEAQAAMGGMSQIGMKDMIAEYDHRYGLDKPLILQYVTYLWDSFHLEFNFSMAAYPTKVIDIIGRSLPWTVTLLSVTTVLAWTIGTILGAILARPNAPRLLRFILAPILTLSAIPFFLLGLLLIYVLGFQLRWFPLAGGYDQGLLPGLDPRIIANMVYHSILPALSIILASIGFWTLGMRGVMVSTHGEDYLLFADAKGLRSRTIFWRYAIRNALLPQLTALALALGNIVSGAVLVEVIFQYPGVGSLLYQSIRASDYYMIQGVVFMIIVAIGFATLIIDLIYPLLDPRISYASR